MDEIFLYSIVISILVVILGGLYFAKSKSTNNEREKTRRRAAIPTRNEDGQIAPDQERVVAGPGGRRRATRMQRRPQPAANVVDEQDDDIEDDEEGGVSKQIEGKVGKKKLAKLQEKADKKANREAMLQIREEEKKKQEIEDAEKEKAALKEKEEEERAEEEERRRKEEKERREEEEYRKLAESFIVDEEGYDETSGADGDSENQLQVFIQYIKETKSVVLEDLAAHFKMKAQDTIDRVTELLEQGHITGVMDDRGKFIYISQEELESIAKFIKQRGRVSISELAENSNKLISLNS